MFAKTSALILLIFSLNFYAQNPSVKSTEQSREKSLEEHISAAETFQIAGDLANAQLENRAIVAIGLHRLGNVFIEEGKFQDAVKTLFESKTFSDNAGVRVDLAVAYLRINEIEKALEEARGAVEADSKNVRARYILGNIYFIKEDYKAALPELEKVLLLAPDFDAARALGLTYLHLKQPARARLLFEEIQSSFKEKKPELHILFGQAYEQTNYPLEAEREFKRALTINPQQARANFFLGYVILQHGGSTRLAEAAQAFEKELQLNPEDFYANFFAGVVASSENRHEKAIEYLQKAVRSRPNSGEAYLFLGQSQMETGDLVSAEKNLRRAAELETDNTKTRYQSRRTHFLLGRLLLRTNRREEGERELEIAKKIQQELLSSARDEISQILGQVVGDGKEQADKNAPPVQSGQIADLTAERAAELKKHKVYLSYILAQAFFNLGVISVQNGDLPDALEKFSAASVWKPDFPNLDRSFGIVAFRAGQYTKAAAPLSRHLKTNPQDTLARQMLGASFYFINDFKAAVETLAPLAPAITENSELAYFYGVSLIRSEKNKEAALVFDKLAAVAEKNPEILNYAAQGFMLLGDFEKALKEFRAIARLSPQTPKAHFFIGQNLIRLNRFDEAEIAFQKELEINPSDESAKYHLALTLLERKIRTEEAIKLLNEAIALRPDYADALYQLGKIHNERGETEKAVERLERAASADARKDYIFYQLSIAYRRASRHEDAEHALKTYQELKAANRKTDNLVPMGNNKNAQQ